MNVELISNTPNPEQLIARAYGICTGKDTIPIENITKWIVQGHETPVEHASASFFISGISRACSHQLVRHRLASFSQRSQRYCTEDDWSPVAPTSLNDSMQVNRRLFLQTIDKIKEAYDILRDSGVPDEDARFVLPNATPTELIMTANFREWLHVIRLRGTEHAQWEIREVAHCIYEALREIAPYVFNDQTDG